MGRMQVDSLGKLLNNDNFLSDLLHGRDFVPIFGVLKLIL